MIDSDSNTNLRTRLSDLLVERERLLPLLVLIGAMLTTTVVYGPSRDFSFMMDDAFDTTWTEQRSYFEILTQRFPGFGYYRPVPFLIFKAVFDLTGEHNTTVLRTVLLAGHAFTAWLLYLFLRRVIHSEWAIAACALFLLFPFSYQALSVIGAIGHVLVTLLLLGSLLLWYEGRRTDSHWLLIMSIATAVVAVWTIEYGVIGLPLLLGLEFWIRWNSGASLLSRREAPYIGFLAIAQVVYFLLWFGTDRPESDPVTVEDMARNGVFWLQVVAYPATRFLNVVFTSEAPGYIVVLTYSVLVLIVGLAMHFILQQTKLALASLAIALLCFLPSIIMLTHEYVLSGPRLLYVVSPAIVTFWALLGRSIFVDKRVNAGWQAVVLLFIGVTLWHSYSLIDRRITMFQASNDVIEAVIDAADSQNGSPVLMVNVPSWFSFHSLADQEYPIGHFGVQGIPPYVGLDGLYYAVNGTSAPIDSVALSPDVSGWTYAFGPHGPHVDHDEINVRLREGQELFVMELTDDGPQIRQPGSIHENNSRQTEGTDVVRFESYLRLNQFSWQQDGERIIVETEWDVIEQLPGDYQIHLMALDSGGNELFEHRNYALSGLSAPRLWQPGDRVFDRNVLALEQGESVDTVLMALVNTGDDSYLDIADTGTGAVDGHWVRSAR